MSVVGALADALLVEAFSTAALALACVLIALNDVLDLLIGAFFAVRLAMLPSAGFCCPKAIAADLVRIEPFSWSYSILKSD
jgi:hypothetical protein